ncbi:MAG: TIGR00374 family protein [Bacteroidia bacterium]|nr:MAG: TIGR00374 family protein [Bacteroidia bacterium]
MNKKIKRFVKYLLFFALGVSVFWWVSKDQDIDELRETLKGADMTWVYISLIIGMLSHISRALRWTILIESMGYKTSKLTAFLSVMIMYLANIAVPRSGELIRCGTMSKTEDIPFSKLLGTVVIERIIDFLMLFILLGIVLATQLPVVADLLQSNPSMQLNFSNILHSPIFIVFSLLFVGILLLAFVFRKRIKQNKLYIRLYSLFTQFAEGIKSISRMKRRAEFVFHSIFIWVMYFVMIYIVFLSFDFTKHITLLTGLTVFVMSSFGMVAPAPGGMGTWHFMVIQTLMIYGIQESQAYAFAITSHTSMTLMLIVVGVISLIFLPVITRKKNFAKQDLEQKTK